MIRKIACLVGISMLVGPTLALADLITTNSLSTPTTLDFSEFSSSPISNANGPIQIGGPVGEDIEYTGDPNTGLYAWNSGWGLVANGNWNSGRDGYLGQNNARPGTLIVTFNDAPVSGVVAFMNHAPGLQADLIISVFNGTTLLESYNITSLANISTPGGQNAGDFRGISRSSADITSFHVYGYVPVIDDLSFTRDVPEPGTLALLGLGLMGIGIARRRTKA